jgi:WD40 repeat protein
MGRASLAAFEGHTQAITFLALSSDRKKLLSSSADGTARLWDVATGKQLQQFAPQAGSVIGVAFAPDDRTAFTVGADRSLRSWNVADGKPGKRWEIEGLVTEIAIAPGSKWLALNISGAKIRLFDMTAGAFGKEIAAMVQQVQLSGDGSGVYGIAYPKRIRRWSTASGEEAASLETSLGAFVNILAVSTDGSRVAVGNRQGVYALFDGAGKELRRTAFEPYETRGIAFDASARGLLIWGGRIGVGKEGNGGVFRLDLATEKIDLRRQEHEMPVTRLVVSGPLGCALYATHNQIQKVELPK